MPSTLPFDDALSQRLPLPLAQLYRRAHNAKSVLERHNAAFYLWEAGLKLLGATAVGVFVVSGKSPDDLLRERLQGLSRPSIGHWWEIVRSLTVELSKSDAGFAKLHELLLGKIRDNLPRVAGLDAALLTALEGTAASRSTVRLTELFERLVRYRNREIGHGAAGQKAAAHYETMAQDIASEKILVRHEDWPGGQIRFAPNGMVAFDEPGSVAFREIKGDRWHLITAAPRRFVFAPDRTFMASTSESGMLKLWDIAGWQQLRKPPGQALNPVRSIAFTKDGKSLITASGTDQPWANLQKDLFGKAVRFESSIREIDDLRVWDVQSRQELPEPFPDQQTPQLTCMTLAADGRTILAGARAASSGSATGSPARPDRSFSSAKAVGPNGKSQKRHGQSRPAGPFTTTISVRLLLPRTANNSPPRPIPGWCKYGACTSRQFS